MKAGVQGKPWPVEKAGVLPGGRVGLAWFWLCIGGCRLYGWFGVGFEAAHDADISKRP